MTTKKGTQVTLRFSADEVEAWRLDAERSGFALAAFLKARIRDGAHYADLTRQIQTLTEERRRDREMLRALLAISFEAMHYSRAVAHPQPKSEEAKATRDTAVAATRSAAREAATAQFAAVYKEQT